MASSGWQGEVTLTDGGFGYDYFKGDLRVDSITHSGGTVTVTGVLAVKNTRSGSGYSYYIDPINARAAGGAYQQIVAGNQHINDGSMVSKSVTFTFSAGASETSKQVTVDWLYYGGGHSNSKTYTLYFDASATAPATPTVTLKETYTNGAKFGVSVSSYGVPSSTSGRYIEAAILGSSTYGAPYRYATASDTASSDITVTSSSSGALTINPNTQYGYGGYASNTVLSTSTVTGTFVTLAAAPTITSEGLTPTRVNLRWSVPADGGKYDRQIQYSVNGGTWITGATVTSGNASNGVFTVGLSPSTAYTIRTRVNTTAGATAGPNITVTTPANVKIYCSVNNSRKKVKRIYCSVNGQRKKVKKIYCSVNGTRKLCFEDVA